MVDFGDFTFGLPTDLNGDGVIDVNDCPYPLGSPAAKQWFYKVLDPYVKSQEPTPEMKALYGDKITGVYKGKPLVPGVAGPGQGDFKYMVDKIRITTGLSNEAASKIAGKVRNMKYGTGPIKSITLPIKR